MYPASSRFDYEYYVSKHLPLVGELWGPLGLVSADASKGVSGLMPGSAPEFVTIASLTFPSLDVLQAVMTSPSAAQVLGDIPNFTDAQPRVQVSEVLA
jgi:uncharacterized protein (TIGR02118 family)